MSSLVLSSQSQHLDFIKGSPSLLIVLNKPLTEYQREVLRRKLLKSGLSSESFSVQLLDGAQQDEPWSAILAVGEDSLRSLTNKTNINKWHLSPLSYNDRLVIPTFDFTQMQRQPECSLYFDMALNRCIEYMNAPYKPIKENFLINPGIEETIDLLKNLELKDEISVDVETGYGQINTVGLAWSSEDAIAINTLPGRCGPTDFYRLWQAIRKLLESDNRKIFQNYIYDTSFFSAYGIDIRGNIFDTMHAMKILWPELEANLGNVGRVYTRRPYWKDDGRLDEEGKKKDWGDIRDWHKHYLYSCRDTTGTFESYIRQRVDLERRDLSAFYQSYIQEIIPISREMCTNGLPTKEEARAQCQKAVSGKKEALGQELTQLVGEGFNPRSPAKIKAWLQANKISIPKKRGSGGKETTDASAIKKIRAKNDVPGLKQLQEYKAIDKKLALLDTPLRWDSKLSYSYNITSNEFLEWKGYPDCQNKGADPDKFMDPDLLPQFVAPNEFTFIRFLPQDVFLRLACFYSSDSHLLKTLDSKEPQGFEVGKKLLRATGFPLAEYPPLAHFLATEFTMMHRSSTLPEEIFAKTEIRLKKKEVDKLNDAFFTTYPAIANWHKSVSKELYQNRRLKAMSGFERYFYGRPGPDMAREGVNWLIRHSASWLMNKFILELNAMRKNGGADFKFVTRSSDSLILLAPKARLLDVTCIQVLHENNFTCPLNIWAGDNLSTLELING